MEFLVILLIGVLVVRWLVLRARFDELLERIGSVEARTGSEALVSSLTARVYALECAVMELKHGGAPAAAPVPAPVAQEPAPEPPKRYIEEVYVAPPPPPPPVPEVVVEPEPQPEPVIFEPLPPVPPPPPPGPSWTERLRDTLGNEEWEALLGGSLLNKLGALVLVIGIALFLAYSFGRVSPAGRAAIAIAVSTGILGTGIWVERRDRYRVFARGLIAAGWAALYATAYAVYALPATRIIESAFVGSIGLLIVAAGMIGHSLRYRTQALTAVAYFSAFAALAATPSTSFAVISLVPLAVSMLYLADRLNWHAMALFGLFATYATCISRGSSGAPLESTQALFLVYWLLFEGFDLLRTRKRLVGQGLEWIGPLNALAFLALSYTAWAQHAPDQLWLASAGAAALYLGSTLIRAFLGPAPNEGDFATRFRGGAYEVYLVLSAVLTGLSIVGRVPGVWTSVWLAVEAEILYLAGVKLRVPFLQRLGRSAFLFSLTRLATNGYPSSQTEVLGRMTWNWTPPAVFHAFLFYVNRGIDRSSWFYSTAAAFLVAAVLFAETPERFIGVAWLVFAAILFEVGLRKSQVDFRIHAYGLVLGACAVTAIVHFWSPSHQAWLPIAVAIVACYAYALRPQLDGAGKLLQTEMLALAIAGSAGAALFASLLIWKTVPEAYVGVAWCILAAVIFEMGNLGVPADMRPMFWPVAALGAGGIADTHLLDLTKFAGMPVWATYLGATASMWAISARAFLRRPENMSEEEQRPIVGLTAAAGTIGAMVYLWIVLPDPAVSFAWALLAIAGIELAGSFALIGNAVMAAVLGRVVMVDLEHASYWNNLSLRIVAVVPVIAAFYWLAYREGAGLFRRVHLWLGSALAFVLIGLECGSDRVAPGWMALALGLLVIGMRLELEDFRFQAYGAALAAFVSAMFFTVSPPQIAMCVSVVAGLYLFEFLSSRGRVPYAETASSIAATVLLSTLLYNAVSGGLLTVSWGMQGLAMLAAGFPLRQRILRLQGLALLLVCILKLFVYDLRNLETMYRILSFIALGIIMLGVSWIYTRFREHIRRYL